MVRLERTNSFRDSEQGGAGVTQRLNEMELDDGATTMTTQVGTLSDEDDDEEPADEESESNRFGIFCDWERS